MRPIAIFYHGLYFLGDPPQFLPEAYAIMQEQMDQLRQSGLLDAATFMLVGLNGGAETEELADLIVPFNAVRVLHGLQSRSENLTIVELEKWVPEHPGWNVLYFHAKGSTHPSGDAYGEDVSAPWRKTMMRYLIGNWRQCIADLEGGNESVGCHFMRGVADGSQNIWAGNFWWATSDFLREVPSIFLREAIKQRGISDASSRYEAEVWIGNGRLPRTMEYLPCGGGGVP